MPSVNSKRGVQNIETVYINSIQPPTPLRLLIKYKLFRKYYLLVVSLRKTNFVYINTLKSIHHYLSIPIFLSICSNINRSVRQSVYRLEKQVHFVKMFIDFLPVEAFPELKTVFIFEKRSLPLWASTFSEKKHSFQKNYIFKNTPIFRWGVKTKVLEISIKKKSIFISPGANKVKFFHIRPQRRGMSMHVCDYDNNIHYLKSDHNELR